MIPLEIYLPSCEALKGMSFQTAWKPSSNKQTAIWELADSARKSSSTNRVIVGFRGISSHLSRHRCCTIRYCLSIFCHWRCNTVIQNSEVKLGCAEPHGNYTYFVLFIAGSKYSEYNCFDISYQLSNHKYISKSIYLQFEEGK